MKQKQIWKLFELPRIQFDFILFKRRVQNHSGEFNEKLKLKIKLN